MKWFTVRIEREAQWGDSRDPTIVYTGMDEQTASQAYAGFYEACAAARPKRSGLHCFLDCRDAETGVLLCRRHMTLRAGNVEESKWERHSPPPPPKWAAA